VHLSIIEALSDQSLKSHTSTQPRTRTHTVQAAQVATTLLAYQKHTQDQEPTFW